MTTQNINTNINQNKIVFFGLDELEIYAKFKHEKMFDEMEVRDEIPLTFEEFELTKIEVPKYEYKILFKTGEYSFGAFYKGDKTLPIPTKDYFVIYSTGFRLFNYSQISTLFNSYFILEKVKRIDITIDLETSIGNLLKDFKELKQSGGAIYGADGKIQTKYFGQVQKSQNKRSLIRVYDKLLDIKKKVKDKLYTDYLLLSSVTRVELEIRAELAKNIDIKDIFNTDTHIGLFKNYLSRHIEIFEELEGEKMSLYRPKEQIVDPELLQSAHYKNHCDKIFLGHARGVINRGACPVRLLINNVMIMLTWLS
ncbi:MAG: hypothetical protein N4A38_00490 [Candidatus Gracilibacteria bacterium]|nr:hypothetical protein [Candidatus Gracilibacteria bacterium]